MKKAIKLKNSKDEIKEFKIKENPTLWKVFGAIMALNGVITLMRVQGVEGVFDRIYDIVDGTLNVYIGLYAMRELVKFREILIKSAVEKKGWVPADDEAKQYLIEKGIMGE